MLAADRTEHATALDATSDDRDEVRDDDRGGRRTPRRVEGVASREEQHEEDPESHVHARRVHNREDPRMIRPSEDIASGLLPAALVATVQALTSSSLET